MNHRRCIPTDREPIIKHLGLKTFCAVTIVFLLGSITSACSESSDDPPVNAATGGKTIATNAGTAGNVDPIQTAGNVAQTAGTGGNVNPVIDAGSDGNVTPVADAGNVTPATDAGNVTPVVDSGNASACSGNYWDITYDLPKSDTNPGYTVRDPTSLLDPPVDQNILLLRGTMFEIGDGNFNIGPGTATVRFENVDGKPRGKAYLLAFEIQIDFSQPPATTNIVGTFGHEYDAGPCGSSAVGNLAGDTLTWSDFTGTAVGTDLAPNAHAYFIDGTVTCDGALCGQFGAPPQGTTPNTGGPDDVRFEPWTFAADGSTFFTPAFIYQQDANSTTSIQIYGAELSRECQSVPACE